MYCQRITREHPSALIFMLDQSGSMADRVTYPNRLSASKAQLVSSVLNSAISEIINRCKTYEDIYDYFHIAVIGYGDYGVKSLLDSKRDFLLCSELNKKDVPNEQISFRKQLPNGTNKIFTINQNQWIKPYSKGNTPMGAAMSYAAKIAKSFCNKHPNSFPAMVFNLSDGVCNDCLEQQIIEKSEEIKAISTNDGNVILMNMHININDLNPEYKVLFPSDSNEVSQNKFAQLLFDTSSDLPQVFNDKIAEFKGCDSTNSLHKAMSYNASLNELFCMINIGSITLSIK